MNASLPASLPLLALGFLGLGACLPRDNPFDRAGLEAAYQVWVDSAQGQLRVHFTQLTGSGVRGYRVYREDQSGHSSLVAEVGPDQNTALDDGAAAALQQAEQVQDNAVLYWRVEAYTTGGEGPKSQLDARASTLALPNTTVDPPLPEYITGLAGVTVRVHVVASALEGAPAALHFRYRFAGSAWTEPIPAGPLVLTGLPDGRYAVEVQAVDVLGGVDLTPSVSVFQYDYLVPEGTSCDPAVCSAGLTCVTEPVGRFCRALCVPGSDNADAGARCLFGTRCRLGSGQDGLGACVAVALDGERCEDRLCHDGLACALLEDQRSLCGVPCLEDRSCADAMSSCLGTGATQACLGRAALGQSCARSACAAGLACEQRGNPPTCRRLCQSTLNCAGAELCQALGRGDLKVCR